KERDRGPPRESLFDADRQLDVKGVRQVVNDHADYSGLRAAQGRRASVIDVAEFRHRVGDALTCRVCDERASAEHQRNCRFGDTGPTRDIDDGRANLANLHLPLRAVSHERPIWIVPILLAGYLSQSGAIPGALSRKLERANDAYPVLIASSIPARI